MRTVLQVALAIGFVGTIAVGAPVATKADEICIGFCVIESDASADVEDRPSRYPYYQRQYRDYDNGRSYYGHDRFQHWAYFEFYYDKWNGSSTQYKTYNKSYDVR